MKNSFHFDIVHTVSNFFYFSLKTHLDECCYSNLIICSVSNAHMNFKYIIDRIMNDKVL